MFDDRNTEVGAKRRANSQRSLTALAGATALVVLLTGWVAYRVGADHSTAVRWHTGSAYATELQIGVQTGGWTYSIPLDVPWLDSGGTFHDNGRPDCLPPSRSPLHVRFAEVTVHVEDMATRQVVFVRCDQ